jgi:type II secretory pathway pseudopilin PulG
MAALLGSLTVMMIGLAVAAPTWHYVVQDDKEQELLFRGLEIVRAIRVYQREFAQTYPDSIEKLYKLKKLRREYKDPMTEDGKWHLIRPGVPEESCAEPLPPPGGQEGEQPQPPPPPAPTPPPGGPTSTFGVVGAFMGVRSLSQDETLRVYMGRNHYNEWCFTPDRIPETIMYVEQLTIMKPKGERPAFTGQFPRYFPRDWSKPPLLER